MWFLTLALAEPPPEAAQLTSAWFARVDDIDGHALPMWSRRQPSTYDVQTTAEGVVRRIVTHQRKRPTETRLYDVRGDLSVRITWGDEPWPLSAHVAMAPPVAVDTEGWTVHELAGGAQTFLPGGPDGPVGEGRLHTWTAPAADVRADAFVAEQLADCGCLLVERADDWLDGVPAVRLRLQTVSLGPPDVALLWAAPRGDTTFLAAYTVPAPADPDRALATGRVVMALLVWPEPPTADP